MNNLIWARAQLAHSRKMILRLSGKPQFASVIAELHERQSQALLLLATDEGEDF
jgi:hypothetical protein